MSPPFFCHNYLKIRLNRSITMKITSVKANPWSDNAYPWRPNLGANPSRQDVFWS